MQLTPTTTPAQAIQFLRTGIDTCERFLPTLAEVEHGHRGHEAAEAARGAAAALYDGYTAFVALTSNRDALPVQTRLGGSMFGMAEISGELEAAARSPHGDVPIDVAEITQFVRRAIDDAKRAIELLSA